MMNGRTVTHHSSFIIHRSSFIIHGGEVMAATWRRWCLLGVFLTAALGSGCNILSLPFFIFGPEPKIEAKLHKLASDEKDKEVKVVILAYSGLETRPEF